MMYVNTIEFNGIKACINSYTKSYVDANSACIGDEMRSQADKFTKMFPSATIKTETLDETATMVLVATKVCPFAVGELSKSKVSA